MISYRITVLVCRSLLYLTPSILVASAALPSVHLAFTLSASGARHVHSPFAHRRINQNCFSSVFNTSLWKGLPLALQLFPGSTPTLLCSPQNCCVLLYRGLQ